MGDKLPGAWKLNREEVLRDLKEKGLSNDQTAVLVDRYGERARDVVNFIRSEPKYAKSLGKSSLILVGEVVFSIRFEYAKKPEDFLRRRAGLFFTKSGGMDVYDEILEIFKEHVPEFTHLENDKSYLDYLIINRHVAVQSP